MCKSRTQDKSLNAVMKSNCSAGSMIWHFRFSLPYASRSEFPLTGSTSAEIHSQTHGSEVQALG